MVNNVIRASVSVAALGGLASIATAHTGHEVGGLASGLAHPISGLDHLLAMVAVGLWAAQLGRKAWLALPGAFVIAMVFGFGLALAGVPLGPIVEPGIAASVLVLGVLIAISVNVPLNAAMAIVALAAVLHGYAHGGEIPESAWSLTYAGGFVLTTALLHAAGLGLFVALRQIGPTTQTALVRAAGGATAMAAAWIGVTLFAS